MILKMFYISIGPLPLSKFLLSQAIRSDLLLLADFPLLMKGSNAKYDQYPILIVLPQNLANKVETHRSRGFNNW